MRDPRPNRWMIFQALGVDVLACVLFVILLARQMYGYAALTFLGAAALTALIALGVSRGWFTSSRERNQGCGQPETRAGKR